MPTTDLPEKQGFLQGSSRERCEIHALLRDFHAFGGMAGCD
jgi:hypothetical protein